MTWIDAIEKRRCGRNLRSRPRRHLFISPSSRRLAGAEAAAMQAAGIPVRQSFVSAQSAWNVAFRCADASAGHRERALFMRFAHLAERTAGARSG